MLVLLCFVGSAVLAAIAPVLGRSLGRNAGWPLAAGLTALGGLLIAAYRGTSAGVDVPWIPALGIDLSLRLDGLSLLFGVLVLFVGALVIAYSARYLGSGHQSGFYTLMTLFAFAMLGLILANDVVVLFVMWELTTLCSFFLIARSGPSAREPAIRTLLVTAAGGLVLLAAVVAMVVKVGSSRLDVIMASPVWSQEPAFTTVLAVLVAVAAFTKCAQFPFHGWLPDAMAAATPVSAYLHAAAMVKAGIYLLMRFSPLFGDLRVWNVLLMSVGLCTAVMGAVSALRRYDLKELLANSTVSQLGFLVAVIGIGTPAALAAAAIHTIAHALFKSALFMLVGIIDHRGGTRDIRRLDGVRRSMPWTFTAVAAAALSMAGVPPLLGFVSKESIFAALLDAPGPPWVGIVAAVVAVAAAGFTVAYSARIVLALWSGPPGRMREAGIGFLWPAALPAAGGVVLGLWVSAVNPLTSVAATAGSGSATDADLALWHGIEPGLFLSLAALMFGVSLVLARDRVRAAIAGGFAPVSALDLVDRWRASTIEVGRRTGDLTRSDSPTRHLAVPVIVLTALAAVGVWSMGTLPARLGGTSQWVDSIPVVMIAVGTIGVAVARSRIAAIAILGIVGFAVTVWFLILGAADVALTQLLVEILTVVVMVVLLRRLPSRFPRVSRGRAVGAGFVAIVGGLVTTAAVLAFTGRRPLSAAGEYFVRNAETDTGGTNVVNTILVDFRALDTLGELTVLGIAGVAVAALVGSRTLLPVRRSPSVESTSPLADSESTAVFGRALARIVGPVMIVGSVIFLLRGHTAPGGGFISALIGGAGFALIYLTASSDAPRRLKLPYLALIGSGVATGVVTGFVGYVSGSFLTPLHAEVMGIALTTALVFDVGVYLAVVGVVLASLNLLGRSEPNPQPSRVAQPSYVNHPSGVPPTTSAGESAASTPAGPGTAHDTIEETV
ncbi:DUF4040 family protein [Rhodococcoides fascians]|uniref:DUF4040 family protein n=1 Tax=Rhodococcoides fascians TaxID=1828 RepID=UPI000568063E|nr:DUF4040 family protein [Rhodococcus fascians]